MNLEIATVTGFFSLPSPSLAEHNPDAYNNAMRNAPEGAGTCAHCGTGILHHVVIRTVDGKTAFIGSQCAQKIGGSVARAASARLTSEQIAERDARQKQIRSEHAAREEQIAQTLRERAEHFADVLAVLESEPRGIFDTFWQSLARQLREQGKVSPRQAHFICKAVFGPRQNKKNRDAWETLQIDLSE